MSEQIPPRPASVTDIPTIRPTLQLLDPEAIDQDDMTIWVHPVDPSLSTIITSDKKANRLFVYDLEGRTIQRVPIPKPGNIDTRPGFPLGSRKVDIVAVNQRTEPWQIAVFAVGPESRKLTRIDDGRIVTRPSYGGCLYHSPRTGAFYFFKTAKEAVVEQVELYDNGRGQVSRKTVRQWELTICEGAVADDLTATVYIAEENRGIWAAGAEPDDPPPGHLVARVGEHGLTADVEGLAIWRPTSKQESGDSDLVSAGGATRGKAGGGGESFALGGVVRCADRELDSAAARLSSSGGYPAWRKPLGLPSPEGGYLIASNQGLDAFSVYKLPKQGLGERGQLLEYAGVFRIEGAHHTDGITVTNRLWSRSSEDLFACHTSVTEAASKGRPVLLATWNAIAIMSEFKSA